MEKLPEPWQAPADEDADGGGVNGKRRSANHRKRWDGKAMEPKDGCQRDSRGIPLESFRRIASSSIYGSPAAGPFASETCKERKSEVTRYRNLRKRTCSLLLALVMCLSLLPMTAFAAGEEPAPLPGTGSEPASEPDPVPNLMGTDSTGKPTAASPDEEETTTEEPAGEGSGGEEGGSNEESTESNGENAEDAAGQQRSAPQEETQENNGEVEELNYHQYVYVFLNIQQGSIVLTGEFSCSDRIESTNIFEAMGLRVSGSIYSKTKFLLIGDGYKQEKIDRALSMGMSVCFW